MHQPERMTDGQQRRKLSWSTRRSIKVGRTAKMMMKKEEGAGKTTAGGLMPSQRLSGREGDSQKKGSVTGKRRRSERTAVVLETVWAHSERIYLHLWRQISRRVDSECPGRATALTFHRVRGFLSDSTVQTFLLSRLFVYNPSNISNGNFLRHKTSNHSVCFVHLKRTHLCIDQSEAGILPHHIFSAAWTFCVMVHWWWEVKPQVNIWPVLVNLEFNSKSELYLYLSS